MKNKSVNRFNCFGIAVIMFALQILSSYSYVCAQVDGNESGADGRYVASTELISSWDTGYNLKVTISNRSNETIHNWGFVFDTQDSIQGYYSALELSKSEKTHLVRNAGYNQDIRPGQQIEFGYTAYYVGTMDIPQSFSLATEEETVNSDNYEARLFSVNEWGNEGQASLTIKNISDKKIEDWKIELDTDLQIENIWGAGIGNKEKNHYTLLNSEYNQNIVPGETVNIGLIYSGSFSDIQNVLMSQVVIRESAVNGATDSNGNEVVSENTPDENNDTDDPSSNDNNGNGNNTGDNTETDIDMETDTDNDGIPDYYEDLIGTSKTETDTDGDTLSDYEELAKTGSDPTVYDSVTEGISDADADSDGDGISNKEELELGLNPASKDSDMDGIKDGEEAAYGTDPLKEDTDGDTIKDGDELVLGFDPLNSVTGGIADNEHRTEQHLDENSEVLAVFNRKNEKYKISVDITAAGLVSSELKLMESPYSGTINNDAIVGLVPHIEYGKSDTIDSITVRFRLDELLNYESGSGSTSDNMSELWDLCDKYGIFCYFEEESLFLPVETLYDEDTNSFYTTTDRAGTYCLMDMAKFLQEQEYLRIQEDPAYINVQFILQCSGADKEAFLKEQKLIIDVFTKMIDQYGEENIRVSVVKFYSSLEPWYVYNGDDDIWFSKPSELKAQLDTVPYSRTAQAEGGKMFRGVYYSLENTIKPNFIFLLQNGAIHCNGWEYTQVELCRAGVYYSEVLLEKYEYSDEEYKNDVEEAIESVGGLQTILGADTADKLFGYVCANTTDAQSKTVYQTITANGWEIVNLASPLRRESFTDTDGDGISDWKEVDTDKLERSLDGDVILPTIKECMQMVDKPYVEAGMKKFERYMDKLPIDSVKMLPIKSSPTRVDTDGDNIPDGFVVGMTGCYQFSDPNPLKSDVTITELEGGYISIDYEKPAVAQTDWSDSFNDGNTASYGGCQMWCGNQYGDDYGGAEVYCSNSVSGNTMHSYGCGVIAVADSLLYQSIVKANKNHTDIYLGTEKIDIYSLTHIDYDEYMRYVLLASQYFKMYENEMIKGVPGAYLKGNLTGGMNILADELGLCITCSWECQEHIWYFIHNIKRMISNGYPIPISYYSKKGDERYELTANCEYSILQNTINDHYNSITGIIEYSADVEKSVGHKVVLEISNWGRKEYIDCYSYFSARSLFQTTMIID